MGSKKHTLQAGLFYKHPPMAAAFFALFRIY